MFIGTGIDERVRERTNIDRGLGRYWTGLLGEERSLGGGQHDSTSRHLRLTLVGGFGERGRGHVEGNR